MAKTEGLRQNNGNFSGQILLNDTSSEDLKWWITNLQKLFHMVKQISLSKLMHLPKIKDKLITKKPSRQVVTIFTEMLLNGRQIFSSLFTVQDESNSFRCHEVVMFVPVEIKAYKHQL
ncbi:hypothetical protein P5673_027066 [Acropora cervicornis]|uniref:Uncharacterized protein n=1 Tax=Acropora cervicornis TaxID=6130 RepID=A0AAD9PZR0_ACRCE|nr:hypothetical protein P5673_027066 [Acropora cervicornis]